MNSRYRLLLPVGLSLLVSSSIATGGDILHFAPKQGAVFKYNVVVQMTIQGAKVVISGISQHSVTNVDSKGFVSSKSTSSTPTVTMNGTKIDIPPSKDSDETSVNRPDGTVASVGGDDTSATRWRKETVETVELPNTPLAVGRSWTWLSPANSKTGAVKTKAQYKVLGSEVIHGITTWKLSVTVKEMTGSTPASLTGTEWISKLNATPVRCRLAEKNVPVQGIPPQTVVTINVELIS